MPAAGVQAPDDATRTIYADFLAEVANLPNVDSAGAARHFRESGKHWASITVRAQNASMPEIPEIFAALADHVEAAHDAESRAVRLLA